MKFFLKQRYRALAVAAAVFSGAPSDTFAQARPNVIFIVADDMGYADMGTQGARGFKTGFIGGGFQLRRSIRMIEIGQRE